MNDICCCAVTITTTYILCFRVSYMRRGFMGNQHKKSRLHKNLYEAETESFRIEPANISLKDMPLETRRKEANKPLFLVRYE